MHVCEPGSAWERQWVVFRDRLKADPALADEYEELKRRLAAKLGHDHTAYTEAKAAFIRSVLHG